MTGDSAAPRDGPPPARIDVSGWLIDEGRAHFGRLVGRAVAPDGSLLVGDDTNGVIYRISYSSE